MKKRKIIAYICGLICTVCAFIGIGTFQDEKVVLAEDVKYVLLFEEYEIENFTEKTSVKSPNGEWIDTDGTFACDKLGRYEIYENGNLAYYIETVYKPFSATFALETMMPTEAIAGETIRLPKAVISTEIETFETYSVSVLLNGDCIQSFENIRDERTYYFPRGGDYTVEYSVIDQFGFELTSEYQVRVNSERVFLNVSIPETWYVLNSLDISAITGFYEGLYYNATISVVEPNGSRFEIANGKFEPKEQGLHIIIVSSEIAGEKLEKRYPVNVLFDSASLFSNRKNVLSITTSEQTDTKKGLEIATSGAGAFVYYNKIIDLNALGNDEEVISFYCAYSDKSDIKEIKVTMTDVLDPSNTVTVYWKRSSSAAYAHLSNMLVECNGFSLGINNEASNWTGELGKPREAYGTLVSQSTVSRTTALNFMFDKDENAIYTYNGTKKIPVLDLDDAEALGISRVPWTGFSTNFVYLSISFEDNIQSVIQVQKIAGEEFTSGGTVGLLDENYLRFCYEDKYVLDENDIKIEAYKNYLCKLPEPILSDVLSGQINVQFTIQKKNEASQFEQVDGIEGYSFIPTEAGEYKAVYAYNDRYGNAVKKQFDFTVTNDLPPSIVIESEDITADIMSLCKLPKVSVSGGVKDITTTITLLYNGEIVEADRHGRLLLDEAGEVKVQVEAIDFIGNTANATFTITVNRDIQLLVIDEELSTIIAGREYILPDFSANDYSLNKNDTGFEMSKTIVVGETKLAEDRKYTSTGDAEYITISYYGGYGTEKEVRKDVTVRVIKSADGGNIPVENYFSYNKTTTNANLFEYGLRFVLTADDIIDFPNPVPVNDFSLEFSFVEGSNFDGIKFILTDYQDKTQVIEIKLLPTDDMWALFVNDISCDDVSYEKGVYSIGSLKGVGYGSTRLKLSSNGMSLCNGVGSELARFEKYLSGLGFDGFTSGLVTIKAEIIGCTEASFVLNSIANQSFSTYALRNNKDSQGPSMATWYEMNKRYPYGDKVILPSAVAFDILQGRVDSITLTILAPSGAVHLLNGRENNEWALVEFGTYKFSYECKDALGNITVYEFSLFVYDNVCPTLTVNGNVKESYTLGEEFIIPAFTSNDNVGVTRVQVIIEDPNGKLIFVNDAYTFSKKGEYRLIYYVSDSEGNIAKKTYEIKVCEV